MDYDTSFTQNRELSWLKFNERVLEEAADKNVELFERLKFLAIFDSNFEEFFRVRVGSLMDLANVKKQSIDNKSNMTPQEQIDGIIEYSKKLYEKKDQVYQDLVEDLKKTGINILKVSELDERDREMVHYYFNSTVEPLITFQIIDRVHPFPRLPNQSLNLIFELEPEKKDKDELIGLIQLPDLLKRYFKISDTRIVLIEDIIKEFGCEVFDDYKCLSSYVMTVTRNADISYDDEDYEVDEDYRSYMKKMVKLRQKLLPVRVEIDRPLESKLEKFLKNKLPIDQNHIFITKSPMSCDFIYEMVSDMPKQAIDENSYRPFEPQASAVVDINKPIMDQVRQKDIILSYPYESMDSFIKLLNEAAEDDRVTSIKITIYRIAKDSRIAKALIKAAENGKEVVVLMELRARFDESNNIIWSSRLEDAGCKIIYGFDHYKCHSKVCLITSFIDNGVFYVSQVGTGNYNEKTSKIYTDFSLITSNQAIGKDIKDLFDNFLIGKLNGSYKEIMVSPKSMQDGLDSLINEQIEKAKRGEDAYIRLKMNSISDRQLIDKLSEASNSGVKIDLMVRGICCILPGIKGKTENIRVYQIVGRFLEHHRVYQFGRREDCKLYISSADFMTRNIRKRVEVACPIYDEVVKNKVLDFMDTMFSDDVKIRELQSNGEYRKLAREKSIIAQDELIRQAEENSACRKSNSVIISEKDLKDEVVDRQKSESIAVKQTGSADTSSDQSFIKKIKRFFVKKEK
ncbi:MAG: RNA degradosome polyphosphate kinase [Finegoldia sp.]|nr:RNA degradosome polyphosphate kinase [Finegoldia sp.]